MPQNSHQSSPNGIINTPQLLVVDADTMMCELLHFKFEDEGFVCDAAHSAKEAFDLDLTQYSLILVDLMAQQPDGIAFTRSVRANADTFNIPIIIVTARSSEDDMVNGLNAGADDYITKPFSSRELIARVRSIIRRRQMMSARRAVNKITYRDLAVDLSAGTVTIGGEPLALTRTEFLILALFLRNRNTYYSRADIQHEAWEDETGVSDRAVDTNISRLRKKLGVYGNNIVNRQGFGYAFRE